MVCFSYIKKKGNQYDNNISLNLLGLISYSMRGDQRGCKRSEATNSALLSGELAEILI